MPSLRSLDTSGEALDSPTPDRVRKEALIVNSFPSTRRRRRGLALTTGSVVALALTAAFAGPAQAAPMHQSASTHTYHVALDTLNNSGASGVANLALRGDQLTVIINARGLTPNQPHAQHLHYSPTAAHTCPPPSADTNGDGVITLAEGVPYYGGVDISLTTSGDSTPASGLALDRMPVAKANGTLHYKRTFTVTPAQAAEITDFVVVQHGIEANGYQVTLPTDCGAVN